MIESLLGALGLSAIHLLSNRLQVLNRIPRSRWLSIAGGVAVAYVLLHLLPELREYHEVLTGSESFIFLSGEDTVYSLTLLGLIIFYGLEKIATERKRQRKSDTPSPAVFWIHMLSYGVYNLLIGYLSVREDRGWMSLFLFFVGIGLHFVVVDHGLHQHHRQQFAQTGRWVLAGAILVGWTVGVLTTIHDAVVACIVAFIAGGILLNTFKEELPEERESRFWAFALGSIGYAAILLVM